MGDLKGFTVDTRLGRVRFSPKRPLTRGRLTRVRRRVKEAINSLAEEGWDSVEETLRELKNMDPRIGTPGGEVVGYRTRLDMTQQQLANKTGMRQAHISAMENNKRPIGVKVAKKLAKALSIDYRSLL